MICDLCITGDSKTYVYMYGIYTVYIRYVYEYIHTYMHHKFLVLVAIGISSFLVFINSYDTKYGSVNQLIWCEHEQNYYVVPNNANNTAELLKISFFIYFYVHK